MMTNFISSKFKWLLVPLTLLTLSLGQAWGYTYTRLESISGIDANAVYVLGIDGTGFHYSGTSNWGLTALPSSQTPYYYTLTPNNAKTSFTAQTKIGNTTYYLTVPTSNTFTMSTSSANLIIGTTQSNAGTDKEYAVANSSTTTRHIRRNGTSGLRSYAGNTGSLAFFYKVGCANPTSLTNGTITSGTAHLSWSDAANTNKYDVYISTSSTTPSSSATPTITVTDQKYADITTGLTASTTYNWWVRAKDKTNTAIVSAWVKGTNFTTTSAAACTNDPTVSGSTKGSFY